VEATDELMEEMRENPKNVRFSDACKLADEFFGEPRQQGTSHRIWKMPWAGDPRVNLQEDKGGKAKAYQVRQLLQAIDRLRAEGGKQRAETKPEVTPRAPRSEKKSKKR
jgi:hypothetical protein